MQFHHAPQRPVQKQRDPKEAGKDLLKDSSYRYMLQGKGTEAIIKATATKSKKEIQQYHTGSAYIDFEGVRVNIDEYFLPSLKCDEYLYCS